MEPTIIIESHIPFIKGIFDAVANVRYLPPEEITPQTMRNADALITRTRTKCNRELLSESRCAIIATATIGTDHIDTDYCKSRGIKVVNAPGCNAPAVAQYVMASILTVATTPLQNITLGIVGVGHVGSIVDQWARSMGMKTLLCDPPRALRENTGQFCSLTTIAAEADIITFHTPNTRQGTHPTYHLADNRFFSLLKKRPIIINSARGPITDTNALIQAINNETVSKAVIDCWEGEPDISPELLRLSTIATPHIAGYSIDGKIRATVAAINAVAQHLNLPAEYSGTAPCKVPATVTPEQILSTYNPLTDTGNLKKEPTQFENLRNNYNLRNEPTDC